MKILRYTLYLSMALLSLTAKSEFCNIFVHGYTPISKNYWGNLERQVHWDSSKDYQDAAVEVANKILLEIKTCESRPVALRAHSYGVPVVFYILGLGNRFSKLYPDHDYVKVFKQTSAFYSYSGAFNGTPIMDFICGNSISRGIGEHYDRSCVKSLTTRTNQHPSSEVTNPGVPTYIIYTSNRHGYANTLGTILGMNGITFWEYMQGVRHQNDSLLPLHSIRGCLYPQIMTDPLQNCEKIHPTFFIDFKYDPDYHHTEYLKDKTFVLEEYQ